MRKLCVLIILLLTPFGTLLAAGACPSGLPVTGNNCYFIAANGSDANSGTSEASPWQHAPGMPNCAGNCAAHTPAAGEGFIFRGGDTWHFGNSSLTPYAGGTWDLTATGGNASACVYEGTQTGCIYYGVDKTWFSSASWTRPILTGDNPISASKVSSCAYQVAGGNNRMVQQGGGSGYYNIFDNFEFTGLCSAGAGGDSNSNVYLNDGGSGVTANGMLFRTNLYIHGWTVTTGAGSNNAIPCTILGGGNQSLQSVDHIVIDGSDSLPGSCAWATFPSFYHFKDSIVRYTTQGVGQWCHDIHDNIFEHIYNPVWPTHGNVLECNDDSFGNAPGQPANTPNVFYNNIMRHLDPNFAPAGQVGFWFCPNTIPEYWYNNLIYDTGGQGDGNLWAVAGTNQYPECTNTGTQKMFNNTISGAIQPCHLSGSNPTGGQYLTVLNELLLNTPYDGSGCVGGSGDASNVSMTWSQGTAQGYMSGLAGTADSNTCANESTTPCASTLATNLTVGVGGNHQAYCTTLASYSSEYAIATEAANACRYGTTDACAYDATAHTMNCPGHTPVARPTITAWDSGASQFSATQAQLPQPPTSLRATVN